MSVTLEKLKLHLRIEEFDNSEDAYLNILMNAATAYVTDITSVANDEDCGSQYELTVFLLIAHWFANREIVSEGRKMTVPYAFGMLMQNLKPAESLI